MVSAPGGQIVNNLTCMLIVTQVLGPVVSKNTISEAEETLRKMTYPSRYEFELSFQLHAFHAHGLVLVQHAEAAGGVCYQPARRLVHPLQLPDSRRLGRCGDRCRSRHFQQLLSGSCKNIYIYGMFVIRVFKFLTETP